MDDELDEFKDELGESDEVGPDWVVEAEPVELLLDSMSGFRVVLGFEEYGLDESVDQLGESGQLDVNFYHWLWPSWTRVDFWIIDLNVILGIDSSGSRRVSGSEVAG